MFSLQQISQAHSQVKSGSDFPSYIRDLRSFGVTCYITYVTDGRTQYFGNNEYEITSPPKYGTIPIADECDPEQFENQLKAHQQGETDYPAFCNDCARTGINKWVVCMQEMTCTYYDKAGREILTEQIPA